MQYMLASDLRTSDAHNHRSVWARRCKHGAAVAAESSVVWACVESTGRQRSRSRMCRVSSMCASPSYRWISERAWSYVRNTTSVS